MEGPKLSIVYKKPDLLRPHKNNAQTHSKSQIRKIQASIEEFGFANPVLIQQDGTIIAGHGRVEAARLLAMTEVPTICLEDLTEDEVRAYVIADNRLAELAGWDKDLLHIELQHLLTLDLSFDVTITGFEVPEIDLIVNPPQTQADLTCIGIEIDPLYVDVAIRRWQAHTGDQAIQIGSGFAFNDLAEREVAHV